VCNDRSLNLNKKIPESLIILILFFVALFIRILFLSKGPFHMDALEIAQVAEKTLRFNKMHYLHLIGNPITVFFASFFVLIMKVIGISDPVFGANFMSAIFGSLSIVAFYLLARKMLDMPGALFCAVVLMFLPLHLSLSTFANNHMISLFFNLLAVYFLFIYIDSKIFSRLILSFSLLALAAGSRLQEGFIIIPVTFLYFAFSYKDSTVSRKKILYRFILCFLWYTLFIILIYAHMLLTKGLSLFHRFHLYYFSHSFRWLPETLPRIPIILTIPGVIMVVVGLITYFFRDRERKKTYFLLLWFLVFFIYFGGLSIFACRYVLLAMVPLLIFQGACASWCYKHLRLSFVIFLFFIFMGFDNYYPTIFYRHRYNLQKEFAQWVTSVTEPNSYIIAIDVGQFLEYYGKRKVLYRYGGLNDSKMQEFFKQVDVYIEKGIPLYIIATAIKNYDPARKFRDTLLKKYHLRFVGAHINEDWHHTSIFQFLPEDHLYAIEKKSTN